MPTINKCPLCGKQNCVENVRFAIDGKWYTGFKCRTNNTILYSSIDEREEQLRQIKDWMDKLNTPNM